MEVCCLKMASRCKPPRAVLMDVSKIPTVTSSHDCGSLSRVVMVRKTDQRLINHKRPEGDPQCEIVTFETIQTYKGHKPDRTVVFKEKQDLNESDIPKSPSAVKFLRSNLHSGAQSLTISSTDLTNGFGRKSPLAPAVNGRLSAPNLMRQKSPSPVATQKSGFTEFEKECLRAHNEVRVKHGINPLKLSKRLCRFADEWAKILASRGTPAHRSNSQYGENIFCSWTSGSNVVDVSGDEPVEHWYSEVTTHVFGKEPSTLKTGHFTQVVWKDSRELGVGMAKNRSGQVFVVCNYDPPGNFIGSFSENVPPIGGFCPKIVVERAPDSLDSSTGRDDIDLFARALLRYHNEYRKKHGAGDLQINRDMCIQSQDWAETLAREDRFAHRPDSKFGENIYCLWSSDRNAKANPKDVVRSWYEEIREYTYGSEPKGAFRAGHFTQLIWKNTREMGVGVAKTKKGKVLVVCSYSPRGNVIGQFTSNVARARFS